MNIDEKLLTEAKNGNSNAWNRVLIACQAVIQKSVQNIVGENIEYTKDITQEVLFTIWENMATFRWENVSTFQKWLLRITKNITLNWLRKEHIRTAKNFDPLPHNDDTDRIRREVIDTRSPDQMLSDAEIGQEVHAIMQIQEETRTSCKQNILTDQQKKVVALRDNGLSFRDIAQKMNDTSWKAEIAEVTVRIHYSHAMKKIQTEIGTRLAQYKELPEQPFPIYWQI
jgi:RNA polymerase sigma factor (sigma-70 family)